MQGYLYRQLPTDSYLVTNLEKYAALVLALRHPTLIPVLDVLREDSTSRWALLLPPVGPWLSLSAAVRRMPTVDAACSIVLSLAEALFYLHQMNFRGAQSFDWGEMVRAVPIDDRTLGLGLMPPNPAQFELRGERRFWGNPRYAAPELFLEDGTPTPAADSFTLGALLFELVTGEPLIQSSAVPDILRELQAGSFRQPASCQKDLVPRLNEFIVRALTTESERRPRFREWSFVMEEFGGRLLPAPTSAATMEPASGAVSNVPEGRTPRHTSVAAKRFGKPTITGSTSFGHGGFASELAVTYEPAAPAEQPTLQGSAVPREIQAGASRHAAPGDVVDCSVFASPEAYIGDSTLVQVFLHRPEQSAEAKALAREFDEKARHLGWQSLAIELPLGARLQVQLSFPGLIVDEPVHEVVWRGRPTALQFGVGVPSGHRLGTVIGTVTVYHDLIPIGHIKFRLTVTTPDPVRTLPQAQPQGEQAHKYELAFISYASKDRAEVLKRVQMLERCHVRYFQDALSLEPGSRWEAELYRQIDACDLFLLFWSHNARESEWVAKEIARAVRRKGGDDFATPEIVPIIIEGPPPAPPPDSLRHLHFDDRLIRMMP